MKKISFLFALLLGFVNSNAMANNCFFVAAEYLYWNVLQSSMSYAVVVDDLTFTNPKVQTQRQKWTSGVRLSAGYALGCGFDTAFSWTGIYNTVKGSTSQPIIIATELLAPGTSFVIGGTGIGGPASARWNLHFNMFDLNFGHMAFENCLIATHPYVGIKGGTIHQNQVTKYDNFFDLESGVFVDASVNQRNNFWGIGPQIGINNAYKLGCGFNIISDFAVSLLYGKLTSTANTRMQDLDVIAALFDSTLVNKKRRLMPNFQLLIGFNWETCLRGCYFIDMGISYEAQYYFHTWRVVNSSIQNFFITNSGFGDLMLHGVTASLALSF